MSIHHATGAIVLMLAATVASPAPKVAAQSAALNSASSEAVGFGEVRTGLFMQGDESYRVVDTAGYRTAADLGSPQTGTVEQVGLNLGCLSCGKKSCGGCDGGCGSGCDGCGSCGACGGSYGAGFVNPCKPCDPFCYITVEALYMDNDTTDRFTMSQDFALSEFDYEWAPRITIGSVPDCVHGYEAVFVGPLEWDRRLAVENLAGGIRTRLLPGAGIDLLDVSAFADFSEFTPGLIIPGGAEVNFISTFQSQRYEAEYWNLEANKTVHAGEFAKVVVGGRYVSYDERYTYVSRSPGFAQRDADPGAPPLIPAQPFVAGRNAGTGILQSETSNDMYGVQVGLDLLYPLCCYGYSDTRVRAAGFLNSADNQFRFVNLVGDPQEFRLFNSDSTNEFAGLIEFSTGLRYQVGEILSLRLAADVWYLTRVASATSQFTSTITQTTGTGTRTNADVLMTGISFGAELRL